MEVKNQDQLGFYRFYQTTEHKTEFCEEIEFFIEGMVGIVRKEQPSKACGIERLLYAITQYRFIKINHLLYMVKPLSVEEILSMGDTTYGAYNLALEKLEETLKNDIRKFYEKIIESSLERMFEVEDDEYSSKKNQALENLIEIMKNFSLALYSDLTAENIVDDLRKIQNNSSIFLKKYEEEIGKRKYLNPEEEERYISNMIDRHLQQGLLALDSAERDLLLDDNIMLWLLKK